MSDITNPTHEDDETAEVPDVWTMLEADAPAGCEPIQDLYSWSTNYDGGTGPMTLFIDLIGWSDDNLGETIYPYNDAANRLGYVELSKLAAALEAYASRPHDVRDYVDALMEAENRTR